MSQNRRRQRKTDDSGKIGVIDYLPGTESWRDSQGHGTGMDHQDSGIEA